MSLAICDQKAFYPLRSLINGPLTDLNELHEIERFLRTVVLHDEISMELEPCPYDSFSESMLTVAPQDNPIVKLRIITLLPFLTQSTASHSLFLKILHQYDKILVRVRSSSFNRVL